MEFVQKTDSMIVFEARRLHNSTQNFHLKCAIKFTQAIVLHNFTFFSDKIAHLVHKFTQWVWKVCSKLAKWHILYAKITKPGEFTLNWHIRQISPLRTQLIRFEAIWLYGYFDCNFFLFGSFDRPGCPMSTQKSGWEGHLQFLSHATGILLFEPTIGRCISYLVTALEALW